MLKGDLAEALSTVEEGCACGEGGESEEEDSEEDEEEMDGDSFFSSEWSGRAVLTSELMTSLFGASAGNRRGVATTQGSSLEFGLEGLSEVRRAKILRRRQKGLDKKAKRKAATAERKTRMDEAALADAAMGGKRARGGMEEGDVVRLAVGRRACRRLVDLDRTLWAGECGGESSSSSSSSSFKPGYDLWSFRMERRATPKGDVLVGWRRQGGWFKYQV